MDRAVNKCDFSQFVSDTLDSMGYSKALVEHRQRAWEHNAAKAKTSLRIDGEFSCIYAGSKGEGVTVFWESDLDIMLVHTDIVCTEGAMNFGLTPNMTVLQLDRESAAPGYTRLRLSRLSWGLDKKGSPSLRKLLNSLIKTDSGLKYISSDIFFSYVTVNRPLPGSLPRQGPSAPSQALGISQDLVNAFRCYCPSILTTWLTRHRSNDWPTPQTIKKISALDAHVVPVGFSLSENKTLEWRICFTLAEIALIHSFNDTQTKVYIMLKSIAKSVLKPVCDAMTSYVMKNLVLWVSELTHTRLFRTDMLIDRLVQCLLILSKFIERKFVPNYMISERNLILGKIDTEQKINLLAVLHELTEEGGSILLRCGKLRSGLVKMYKTPEVARQEREEKERLERQRLMQSGAQLQHLLKPKMPITGMLHPLYARQGPVFNALGRTTGAVSDTQNDSQGDEMEATLDDPAVQELWKLGKNVGTRRWNRLKYQAKKEK